MQAMRARRALIPGILAVAVTVLSACGKDNKPPAAQTPEVKVVTLKDENVTLDSSLPGRTMPYRIAEVRPQVNGILQKRLFVEGSDVKQGQQLYQIDPSTYEATAKSAEANLESARLLAERYGKLVGEEAVSKQQYAEAQASYLQAKAAVDQAQINLRYTKVLSPISGRISRSLVTEGALVTNGQANALATIQQLDPIYVDVTSRRRQSSACVVNWPTASCRVPVRMRPRLRCSLKTAASIRSPVVWSSRKSRSTRARVP
jgi:membrane fusion protein (multidrug efflux system)